MKQHEKRTKETLIELMREGVANVTVGTGEGWQRHVTRCLMDCAARMPLQ